MADKSKEAINKILRNSRGAGIGAGLLTAAAVGAYGVMQSMFTGIHLAYISFYIVCSLQ